MEIIKLAQSYLIKHDIMMYDKDTGFSTCRNSDLIEEMGQVEFIFSDKTGTLTCNVMEFKMCSINGVIYNGKSEMEDILQKIKYESDKEKL
jgi:phospholipid-transporting ATPase